MDKEMMEKVNEVLKARGKRELSMDEMDRVSGGQTCKRDGVYYIVLNGLGEVPLNDYGEMLKIVLEGKGFDATLEFANLLDPNPHNYELLKTGGWEMVEDYYKKHIDGDITNPWYI